MDEKKSESGSCCGSSCSCGGKKFIIGLFIGLLLAAAAFGFFSAGMCAGSGKAKCCPLSQMPMQSQPK